VVELNDSIEIAASVKRTFDYLADIERVPEWLPNISEAHLISEIDTGPGAEIAIVMNVAGKDRDGTCRCVEMEAPRLMVLESTIDIGVTSKITLALTPSGRHAQVAATVDYTLTGKGFGRLLGGLFGDNVARRDMRAALENLKAQLEATSRRRKRGAGATTS
jgi:uncharacterized protein YndB with AHSA1/START domain